MCAGVLVFPSHSHSQPLPEVWGKWVRGAAVRAGLPVLQGSADFCTVPDAGRKDRRADFTHPDQRSEAGTMRMCVKHEPALNKVELASKARPVKVAEHSSYPYGCFTCRRSGFEPPWNHGYKTNILFWRYPGWKQECELLFIFYFFKARHGNACV